MRVLVTVSSFANAAAKKQAEAGVFSSSGAVSADQARTSQLKKLTKSVKFLSTPPSTGVSTTSKSSVHT